MKRKDPNPRSRLRTIRSMFEMAGAPSAQDFVNKVAVTHFEIQSSQIALAKQADADTKPFAEKMVQDHQKTSSELKALVDGGKVKARLPRRSIPSIKKCWMT